MSVGKRLSPDEPLTEHDVAERLSKALERVYRILADVEQDPRLHRAVLRSRYLSMLPNDSVRPLERFYAGPVCDHEARVLDEYGCNACQRCGHEVWPDGYSG